MGRALWRGASATSYGSMQSVEATKALMAGWFYRQPCLSSVLQVVLVLTKLILGEKRMILSIHRILILCAQVTGFC